MDDLGVVIAILERLEYLHQFGVCFLAFLCGVVLAFVFLYGFRFP